LGGGGVAPRILGLDTGWGWVVGFASRPLCPGGGSPWCLLGGGLDGPRSRSGRGVGEGDSWPLLGLEPPDHAARGPALYLVWCLIQHRGINFVVHM
jgi:hypothetical protein